MNMTVDRLVGIPVEHCEYLETKDWKQVRFPRSRKRRMRKKWAKDRRNWGQVEGPPFARMLMGKIIANRAGIRQLERNIRKHNERS